MSKSITFVLGSSGKLPSGGLKIVYEYATRLSARSWRVIVIHPKILRLTKRSFYKYIRFYSTYFYGLIFKSYLPTSWFKIGPEVRMKWVPDLNEKFIPDADCIVAVSVETASFVNSYSRRKGRKYYFIQGFEDWSMKKEEIEMTWKYPMKKIVISKWLQNKVLSIGENVEYIPNGLDFSFLNKINPFNERPLKSIFFISHLFEFKGTKYALKASEFLMNKYPEFKIKTFSAYKKSVNYPSFIEYYQTPPQEFLRNLYNSCAIFIAPSLSEGWDLPLCEAMLCGCVCVATDIDGHREYIEDNVNGFYCVPASAESIVAKVEYIINNPDRALKVSENAPHTLKKFDWDSRVDLLEQALLSNKP
jgi:glycosyltransferase involved in cell wall biosynthesis